MRRSFVTTKLGPQVISPVSQRPVIKFGHSFRISYLGQLCLHLVHLQLNLSMINRLTYKHLFIRSVLQGGSQLFLLVKLLGRIILVNVCRGEMVVSCVSRKSTSLGFVSLLSRKMGVTNHSILHPQLQQAKTFRKAQLKVQVIVRMISMPCLPIIIGITPSMLSLIS